MTRRRFDIFLDGLFIGISLSLLLVLLHDYVTREGPQWMGMLSFVVVYLVVLAALVKRVLTLRRLDKDEEAEMPGVTVENLDH